LDVTDYLLERDLQMNISLEEIDKYFLELTKIDLAENSSYSLVKDYVNKILSNIPLTANIIPAGTKFFRCRLHSDNNFFYSPTDLSYNPCLNRITSFGRLN
jgi:hypothetical protein